MAGAGRHAAWRALPPRRVERFFVCAARQRIGEQIVANLRSGRSLARRRRHRSPGAEALGGRYLATATKRAQSAPANLRPHCSERARSPAKHRRVRGGFGGLRLIHQQRRRPFRRRRCSAAWRRRRARDTHRFAPSGAGQERLHRFGAFSGQERHPFMRDAQRPVRRRRRGAIQAPLRQHDMKRFAGQTVAGRSGHSISTALLRALEPEFVRYRAGSGCDRDRSGALPSPACRRSDQREGWAWHVFSHAKRRRMARASVVFPAPRSPCSATASPIARPAAIRAPSASVPQGRRV